MAIVLLHSWHSHTRRRAHPPHTYTHACDIALFVSGNMVQSALHSVCPSSQSKRVSRPQKLGLLRILLSQSGTDLMLRGPPAQDVASTANQSHVTGGESHTADKAFECNSGPPLYLMERLAALQDSRLWTFITLRFFIIFSKICICGLK